MAVKKLPLLLDPKAYRKECGLNQTEFWNRYGVNQSAGSRNESRQKMHTAVAIMITLQINGDVTDKALERARAYTFRDFTGKSKDLRFRQDQIDKLDKIINGIDEYRRSFNMAQIDFWRYFGTGQSSGSRYATGKPIPPPVIMLLVLFIEALDFKKLEHAVQVVDKTYGRSAKKFATF